VIVQSLYVTLTYAIFHKQPIAYLNMQPKKSLVVEIPISKTLDCSVDRSQTYIQTFFFSYDPPFSRANVFLRIEYVDRKLEKKKEEKPN
jgi:hypothetical protein